MKTKLMLFSLILVGLLATNYTSEASIYRGAKGGDKDGAGPGKTGYESVETFLWESVILCRGGGAEECPKGIISPSGEELTPDHHKSAVQYALDQISSGKLSGSDFLYGTTNVEWNSSDVDATTSEIYVWDDDEEKPTPPAE